MQAAGPSRYLGATQLAAGYRRERLVVQSGLIAPISAWQRRQIHLALRTLLIVPEKTGTDLGAGHPDTEAAVLAHAASVATTKLRL